MSEHCTYPVGDCVCPQRTGLTEMGWILEAATEGELAAYEEGCKGMMAALERILDGKDDGAGVANQPWEGLRRRVIALVQESHRG